MIGQQTVRPRSSERPTASLGFRRPGGNLGGYLILTLLALIYLIPILFVFQVSLMSSRQFALNVASFPNPIMWSNFPDAWVKGAFAGYYLNTLIYTTTVVFGTLAVSALAAYPIARNHVRWSNGFYLLFLSGILLPVGIIPQFYVMHQIGLFDTKIGYILLWISRLGLPMFVLIGFIKSIPSELDDAAAIDGCPYIRYIFQVVAPLLSPALAVVGLILAIRTWNDIIGPVIFLPSRANKPISAGLFQFFGEFASDWTLIAAAIIITASPLILLYLFTQRYIIAGMTSGALKG